MRLILLHSYIKTLNPEFIHSHLFTKNSVILTEAKQLGMAEREETEKKKEGESFSIWDLPDVPQKLPPHIEFQRTRVQCNLDAPIHVIILLRPFRFFFFGTFQGSSFVCFHVHFLLTYLRASSCF